MDDFIVFDREKFEGFKKTYEECKEDSFMFDGREFYKPYAKYVIDYLNNRLKWESWETN